MKCSFPEQRRRLGGAAIAAVVSFAGASQSRAAKIGDVFVIALENHNFTQPSSYTSTQQIKGNAAAPFINSLITPGNANAANVSYATNYTNSGTGVHPSEPNYIWDEAGTNYNPATSTTVLSDNDPSAGSGNIFTTSPHLTGLMDSAGVSWKNYQEDYQISGQGASVTASGTLPGGATNPYNASTLYAYAPKHDPMAFFSDTATLNLHPISQLATDLSQNTVGQYNWITPNLYNDMHTALSAGFTYHGTHYTGDQAAVAQGDNFLSIVIPQIEASAAFRNNGAIIIWNDETEGGDSTNFDMTEIVISPLAKGNAYASSVALNHSSDTRTMQEIFGLGPTYLNNAIPSGEYSPATGAGTFNTPSASNDLSDLFQAGSIAQLPIVWSGGTGNWSTAAKWLGGVVPASSAVEVQIDHGNAVASVVTLDQSYSVADVILDANDTLLISAGQTLTLNGPAVTALNGSVTVSGTISAANVSTGTAASFTLASSGKLVITSSFVNRGTTTLTGSQNWASGALFNNSAGTASFASDAGAIAANLTVNVIAGTVTFSFTQHLAALNISTGTTATLTGGGNGNRSMLVTAALSDTGTLNLTGNDLDLKNAGPAGLAAVRSLIQQGCNLASGGNWNGSGITSSTAANDTTHLTAVGVLLNTLTGGMPLYTSLDGTSVALNDVLVKYTYYGDANLDGKIDGSDYSLLDNGDLSNGTLTGWFNGDFNYDGIIDGSDYTLIDNAFNGQSAQLDAAISTSKIASGSAVPEPASCALTAISAIAVISRRRRR